MKEITRSAWSLKDTGYVKFWEIHGSDCVITIDERPSYCDRGKWLAKLHATGRFAMEIDSQDGWPRYYFDLRAAKSECAAWLKKRKQWITKQITKG